MLRQNGFFIWDKVSALKKTNGQATFEYFVLFIIFAFVCFAGMIDLNNPVDNPESGFVRIRNYIHDISDTAVKKLLE